MDEKLKQEIALFKFSLISPLVNETFTQSSAKEYLEEISSREYITPKGVKKEYAPETIKEWLRIYRKYGIDGLYPKVRSDKGRSQLNWILLKGLLNPYTMSLLLKDI